MKWMRVVAAVVIVAAMASVLRADAISDALEKALKLYKAGNFLGAQKELAKAAELIEPKAIAQIPPATVKDLAYINYEQGFKVSAPNKDWKIQPLVAKPTPDAITTMVTMSAGTPEGGEIAIFYVRNLKEALGSRFATVVGNESAVLKAIAEGSTNLVKNLSDCTKPAITELKVGGKPGVRSEFTGKRETTAMHCQVVQVLAGEKLFTAIFIATEPNWPTRSKEFAEMTKSMEFDVPIPEPVTQPTEKTK